MDIVVSLKGYLIVKRIKIKNKNDNIKTQTKLSEGFANFIN